MSEKTAPGQEAGSAAAGHELRDVSIRPIVRASIGLAALIVATLIAMRLLFSYYALRESAESRPANPLAAEFARNEPPQPRLQTAPIEDLRKLRKFEDALLSTYGWVERRKGIVRIPIEWAMDLTLERGSAARQGKTSSQ
jgi:hypothetical protein